jgi:hypothetical protein
MKEEELKRLIEKYYNGESTVEEEKSLRKFFRYGNIPRGYEAEKVIFGFYDESAPIPEPSVDFESRILAGIDASGRGHSSLKIKRFILPALSAAAGLLLLAGSYFFFTSRAGALDTFKDPEIAYSETIKILRDVSTRMNRGAQALEPVGKMNEVSKKSFETFNKSTRIVEKNLKSLNYLQDPTNFSNNPAEKNINK